jgi:hypothetical protein
MHSIASYVSDNLQMSKESAQFRLRLRYAAPVPPACLPSPPVERLRHSPPGMSGGIEGKLGPRNRLPGLRLGSCDAQHRKLCK